MRARQGCDTQWVGDAWVWHQPRSDGAMGAAAWVVHKIETWEFCGRGGSNGIRVRPTGGGVQVCEEGGGDAPSTCIVVAW